MESKNIQSITTPLSAKSISVLPLKPNVGIPPNGFLDIIDVQTESRINPVENIQKLISKEATLYQSKEELCYLLKSSKDSDGSYNSTKALFFTELCSRNIAGWTLCEFKKSVTVTLKGLCSASPTDRVFFLLSPNKFEPGRPGTFVGITGWILKFNAQGNNWIISHTSYKQNSITLWDTKRRPFGKSSWVVDNYACNLGRTKILELQISSCETDQYTCNDGTCISFDSRCDKKEDCADVSDEKNCQIVSLDVERYQKDDPPIKDGEKVNVTLSMNVQNILEIQEVQKKLSLKFNLEEAWLDSRLQFYNLKKDEEMNTLISNERNMIWVPRFYS